jgi:fructose-1-phosphate kinase PfkB-like protein
VAAELPGRSRSDHPKRREGNPAEIKRRIESLGNLPGELYISLGPKGMYYSAKRTSVVPLRPGAAATAQQVGGGDSALAGLVRRASRGFPPRKRSLALSAALLAQLASPVPETWTKKS